jgi:hypothetical protein
MNASSWSVLAGRASPPPAHCTSWTCPRWFSRPAIAGLVYVGLENQRSFASNTLRGVSADATAVVAPLAAWIRDAPAVVGIAEVEPAPLTLVN